MSTCAAAEERARGAFERAFGVAPAQVATAPGRVNLIGEHTDYNQGYVLPMPVPVVCAAAVGPGEGEHRVVAADVGADCSLPVGAVAKGDMAAAGVRAGSWQSYVFGVMHLFAAELERRGQRLPVVRVALASDVPMGAGLSSSAALEVAVARAVLKARPEDGAWYPDAVEIARLCQRAENEFAGVPCGIMDQLVAAAGTPGAAAVIDCRSLAMRKVPLPDARIARVVVMDTGVRHRNSAGTYAARRAACVATAAELGVAALRDADGYMLEQARGALTQEQWACALHVVAENQRVLMAGEALRGGNMEAFGGLMKLSHASLRDLYRVSCPELDCLVEAACGAPGVFGARMTGAGLGGCVVALVRPEAVSTMRAAAEGAYRAAFDREPTFYEL
jgi:galactokinase